MRYLLLTIIFISGCGHASKRHEAFLNAIREKQACYENPACDSPDKRARLKEEGVIAEKDKIRMKSGTSIEEYTKVFGEPQSKELSKGQLVYWYDEPEPFFAVFEDGKLVSYFIDRNTLNRRSDKREAEMRDDRMLNRKTHCTSTNFGGTTFSECK